MILSWLQIRRHYAETADSSVALKAILNLVDEITASQYADGLFAWTSMHDLCIAQTCVTYPYDGPYLRISPRDYGQLEFQYLDTPAVDKQWHRTVDGDDAFGHLESFVTQLHWFA
ncbi:MAG TPA: hypothetical protein VE961_21835 [Pyrinomonadaceae bacterium]|nr:hypothetical protein [Pyrinomonadaceae bacterium]